MRTFKRCIVIAVISLALFACKKEKSGSKRQLVMIRTSEGDSISWRTFSYDAQNRLSAITDSNNNGSMRKMVVSYDAQGKLSQAIDGIAIYKFEYDNSGRVARKLFQYQSRQTTSVMETYGYDANGRLIADTSYDPYWGSGMYNVLTYTYDAAGNVTTIESKDKSGNTTQKQQRLFDSHSNPLEEKTMITYLFDIEEGDLPQGKNNLLKRTFDDGTIVYYTYQYNGNGLPKSCSFYDSSDPLIEYVDYYYQ